MYDVFFTAQFKKDFKRIKRQGRNTAKLTMALDALLRGEIFPESMRDHALSGDYRGHRECHIAPDWLLIYRIDDNALVLTATRTGSHAELF